MFRNMDMSLDDETLILEPEIAHKERCELVEGARIQKGFKGC